MANLHAKVGGPRNLLVVTLIGISITFMIETASSLYVAMYTAKAGVTIAAQRASMVGVGAFPITPSLHRPLSAAFPNLSPCWIFWMLAKPQE